MRLFNMKRIRLLSAFSIGVLLAIGGTVYAATGGIPVSVPTATGANFVLLSDSTGRYTAVSTSSLGIIGGSGVWPFTTGLTNFGTSTQATTTPGWFKMGIYASSTSQFVYASTTALSAATLCLTGDTCRSTWPSAGAGVWPFTPSTNFGVPVQSTSTPEWFTNGLYASSTSQLVNASTSQVSFASLFGNALATSSAGTTLGTLLFNGTNFYAKLGTATTSVGNGGWFDIASSHDIDVFLIAGQSNAVGAATDNTGALIPVGDSVYKFRNGVLSAVASDPVCNTNNGSAWPQFGITYYNLTHHRVLLVCTAVGGTGQNQLSDTGNGNWYPNQTPPYGGSGSTLYADSLAKLSAATSSAIAAGFNPVFKGILWVQGENDGVTINSATETQAEYIATMETMISQYRTNLGANTPFYIFRTGRRGDGLQEEAFRQIREAQEQVAASNIFNYLVFRNAVDFVHRGLQQDPATSVYHYLQAGYNEMGNVGAQNVVTALKTTPGTGWYVLSKNAYFNLASTSQYILAGVATTTPTQTNIAMELLGDTTLYARNSWLALTQFASNSALLFKRAGGTVLNPTAVSSGDKIGSIEAVPFDGGTPWATTSASIGFYAAETQTTERHGSYINFSTTPNVGAAQTIGVDAGTSTKVGTGVTALSASQTVGSGSNRILVCGLAHSSANDIVQTATNTTSGVQLTRAARVGGTTVSSEIWYELNPPTGVNNVNISFSSAPNAAWGCQSFSNVSQISPFGTNTSTSSNMIGQPVQSITTTVGDLMIDVLAKRSGVQQVTLGLTSQTALQATSSSALASASSLYMSYTLATTTTTYSGWDWTTTATQHAYLQIPLQGASANASILTEALRINQDGKVGIGTTSPYLKLSVAGPIVGDYYIATTSTASSFPYASTTALSATTLCFTGDTCRTTWPSAGAGVWPFTPTTNYGVAVQSTSTPEWFTNGLHASSTSQIQYASTTALSATTLCLIGDTCISTWPVGGGSGFSTTSADYWQTQRNFFSTTSADYWKTQNNFFSTTSADYWVSLYDKGYFFSTTSVAYWKSITDLFSTTSVNYWLTQKTTSNLTEGSNLYYTDARVLTYLDTLNKGYFYSTTSASYFLSQNQGNAFSTTSATYHLTTSIDTSAEIAAILTDETGTAGNLVFSTSPTFTGTINAEAASLSSTLSVSGLSALASTTITGPATSSRNSAAAVATTTNIVIYDPTNSNAWSTTNPWGLVAWATGDLGFPGKSYSAVGPVMDAVNGNNANLGFFSDVNGAGLLERMRMTLDGNFLIGTTSSAAKLTVQSASGNLLRLVNSVGTIILGITNTGIATILGEWDFGGATSLEIPNGTAPTVDATGECAWDTTDDQLICGDSGNTARVVAHDEFRIISTTIHASSTYFASGQSLLALQYKDALEITQFLCSVENGTSKVLNFTDGTNDTETITCTTGGASDTDVATNDTFTAGELGYIEFGATTGNVTAVHIEVWARITRE